MATSIEVFALGQELLELGQCGHIEPDAKLVLDTVDGSTNHRILPQAGVQPADRRLVLRGVLVSTG